MDSNPQISDNIYKQFSQDIDQLFGNETVSIILFGSAVTPDYQPKQSDINFLVVLTGKGIEQIYKVQAVVSRWKKKGISLPLFLTKEYIEASLDSFPVEFLNMKSGYFVIQGTDVLKDILINKEDLRLQCEREIKGKLIQLRQRYINTEGKTSALKSLIAESILTFISIFKGLLFLKGKEIPETKQDVLLEICRDFNLDESLFSAFLSLRGYGAKMSKTHLKSNVQKYIREIEHLSEKIDQLKI